MESRKCIKIDHTGKFSKCTNIGAELFGLETKWGLCVTPWRCGTEYLRYRDRAVREVQMLREFYKYYKLGP